jgi:hypothetical protein
MTAGLVTVAPDVEMTLREYLRGVDLGSASGRVFFGRPDDGVYPYVAVDGQIGGAISADLPMSSPRIQITVHGSGRNATRAIADLVSAHLAAAATTVVTLPSGTARIDAVDVTGGPNFVPDNTAKVARFVITAVVAIRHTAL